MFYINPLCGNKSNIYLNEDGKKYFPNLYKEENGGVSFSDFYIEKRNEDFYIETLLKGEELVSAIQDAISNSTYVEKTAPKNTRGEEPIQLSLLTDDFLAPREKHINSILKQGSLIANGKLRIYDACVYGNPKKFASFLKDEYGLGGSYDSGINFESSSKGLRIEIRGQADPEANFETLLTWDNVAKRITELVNKGEYLTEKEENDLTEYYAKKQKREEERLAVIHSESTDVQENSFTEALIDDLESSSSEQRSEIEIFKKHNIEFIEIDKFPEELEEFFQTVPKKPKLNFENANDYGKRYFSLEQEYGNAIVVSRLGDFYEIMGENANVSAKALDLILTGRNIGLPERVPMVGFPYHVKDKYINKLNENFNVVIDENNGQAPEFRASKSNVVGNDVKTDYYGIVYNFKGLKEENYLYTARQLEALDKSFVANAEDYEGAFSANKTYTAFKLTRDTEEATETSIKEFLTGQYNSIQDDVDGWYWETKRDDLFTGGDNPTTIKWIELLDLSEEELCSPDSDLPDDYPYDLPKGYHKVSSKVVYDSNGFTSIYSWWKSNSTDHHVFYFDDGQDWDVDSEREAQEWFDNYRGFEEEIKADENNLKDKTEQDMINDAKETAKFMTESTGVPHVVINWSENSYFMNASVYTLDDVNSAFKRLNNEYKAKNELGYDKTAFDICFLNDKGQYCTYHGRYDIGSEKGDLIEHVQEYVIACTNEEEKTTLQNLITVLEKTQGENPMEQADFIQNQINVSKEQNARLDEFIEEKLKEIKWLAGRTDNFTEDEIEDIVNDLKVDFEGSEFADKEFFDDWYDEFAETTLTPKLSERLVKNTDKQNQLIERVKTEFEEYRKETLKLNKEEVFDLSHKTYVLTEISSALNGDYSFDNQYLINEENIETLLSVNGNLLDSIYQEYIFNDNSSVHSLTDTVEFINDYCETQRNIEMERYLEKTDLEKQTIDKEADLSIQQAEEQKKWLSVTVSQKALINKYEKTSFMKMPNGKYQDYTYNVFNNRIKESTLLVDLQSDGRELAYTFVVGEHETVVLKNSKGEKIELSGAEFRELVNQTSAQNYEIKNFKEHKEKSTEIKNDSVRQNNQNEGETSMNNSLILQGRVAEKPKITTSAKGIKYCHVAVEIKNPKTENSQIINVTLFNKNAEKIESLSQGAFIEIKGRSAINNKALEVIGSKVTETEEGYKNTFSLSGFVNNKDIIVKESANGNKFTNVALSVRNDYEKAGQKYETLFISAFGTSAEKLAQFKQKDLIQVSGAVNVDNDGRLSLVGQRAELIRSTIQIQTQEEQRQNTNDVENN